MSAAHVSRKFQDDWGLLRIQGLIENGDSSLLFFEGEIGGKFIAFSD